MRQLIRQLERAGGTPERVLAEDDWCAIEDVSTLEAENAASSFSLILPLERWRSERERWSSWAGRLGVRIGPADRVETLEPDLDRLALVVIEFSGPSEGRGYSQARVLRDRFRFRGEIRAVGHVKLDQLFFLARCGFDAFELSPGVKVDEALAAFGQFDVAYQPGALRSPALRHR